MGAFLSFRIVEFVVDILFEVSNSIDEMASSFSDTMDVNFVDLSAVSVCSAVLVCFMDYAVARCVGPNGYVNVVTFSLAGVDFYGRWCIVY